MILLKLDNQTESNVESINKEKLPSEQSELQQSSKKKEKKAIKTLTICYDNGASCNDCPNQNKLMCRIDWKDSAIFAWPFLTMVGFLIAGIIISMKNDHLNWLGLVIFLAVYFGYMFFFFNIWESKVLCSHCPFYVIDDSKTLKCYANYGFLKTAPYNPAPISKSEQIQFAIGAVLLFAIPSLFLLIVQSYLLAVLIFVVLLVFILNTMTHSCKKCPNFSCLLNRTPKEWRDEYLKRNSVMRKAWEDAGYHIE